MLFCRSPKNFLPVALDYHAFADDAYAMNNVLEVFSGIWTYIAPYLTQKWQGEFIISMKSKLFVKSESKLVP